MATKIKQLRFYNAEADSNGNIVSDPNNAPSGVSYKYYCDDTSFRYFAPIYQLGSQTLPGTKVYFNQSTTPVIIGASGVYELDLTNTTAILNSIRIDPESMQTINDLPNGYLIVDLVYGGEGT